ncbi:hypothetical protein BSR55_11855 [Acinetobacter bereziniae]|nr:hypothetical protein BSR55_11855 [Acinetobacter bereziniae]
MDGRHVEWGYMSKKKALVCFQRKSETPSTQNNLNFKCKTWHCKLYISKQYIYRIDFIDLEIIFTV